MLTKPPVFINSQGLRYSIPVFSANSSRILTHFSNCFFPAAKGLDISKIKSPLNLEHPSSGKRFHINSIKKMVSLLEKFIREDTAKNFLSHPKYDFMGRLTSIQRLKIYKSVKNVIHDYMEEHSMGRPRNWKREYVKAYHVLKLLKRNLGFDVLSFSTLGKSIFKVGVDDSGNNFARHHFRNAFFRKLSNYVQDLILTDSKNHNKYKSYSEEKMLIILNGFDEMMKVEGRVTRSDVINIFQGKEKEWVLTGPDGNGGKNKDQGWFFSDKKFDERLAEFNDRKNLLKNKGLNQFIIEKYNTVYERFYLNFPHGALSNTNIAYADGFYSLVVPHPWLGDFAMGMNFEARFLYPEY